MGFAGLTEDETMGFNDINPGDTLTLYEKIADTVEPRGGELGPRVVSSADAVRERETELAGLA